MASDPMQSPPPLGTLVHTHVKAHGDCLLNAVTVSLGEKEFPKGANPIRRFGLESILATPTRLWENTDDGDHQMDPMSLATFFCQREFDILDKEFTGHHIAGNHIAAADYEMMCSLYKVLADELLIDWEPPSEFKQGSGRLKKYMVSFVELEEKVRLSHGAAFAFGHLAPDRSFLKKTSSDFTKASRLFVVSSAARYLLRVRMLSEMPLGQDLVQKVEKVFTDSKSWWEARGIQLKVLANYVMDKTRTDAMSLHVFRETDEGLPSLSTLTYPENTTENTTGKNYAHVLVKYNGDHYDSAGILVKESSSSDRRKVRGWMLGSKESSALLENYEDDASHDASLAIDASMTGGGSASSSSGSASSGSAPSSSASSGSAPSSSASSGSASSESSGMVEYGVVREWWSTNMKSRGVPLLWGANMPSLVIDGSDLVIRLTKAPKKIEEPLRGDYPDKGFLYQKGLDSKTRAERRLPEGARVASKQEMFLYLKYHLRKDVEFAPEDLTPWAAEDLETFTDRIKSRKSPARAKFTFMRWYELRDRFPGMISNVEQDILGFILGGIYNEEHGAFKLLVSNAAPQDIKRRYQMWKIKNDVFHTFVPLILDVNRFDDVKGSSAETTTTVWKLTPNNSGQYSHGDRKWSLHETPVEGDADALGASSAWEKFLRKLEASDENEDDENEDDEEEEEEDETDDAEPDKDDMSGADMEGGGASASANMSCNVRPKLDEFTNPGGIEATRPKFFPEWDAWPSTESPDFLPFVSDWIRFSNIKMSRAGKKCAVECCDPDQMNIDALEDYPDGSSVTLKVGDDRVEGEIVTPFSRLAVFQLKLVNRAPDGKWTGDSPAHFAKRQVSNSGQIHESVFVRLPMDWKLDTIGRVALRRQNEFVYEIDDAGDPIEGEVEEWSGDTGEDTVYGTTEEGELVSSSDQRQTWTRPAVYQFQKFVMRKLGVTVMTSDLSDVVKQSSSVRRIKTVLPEEDVGEEAMQLYVVTKASFLEPRIPKLTTTSRRTTGKVQNSERANRPAIRLKPYQRVPSLVLHPRSKLRRLLVQAPTGSGKTAMFLELASAWIEENDRVRFEAIRKGLNEKSITLANAVVDCDNVFLASQTNVRQAFVNNKASTAKKISSAGHWLDFQPHFEGEGPARPAGRVRPVVIVVPSEEIQKNTYDEVKRLSSYLCAIMRTVRERDQANSAKGHWWAQYLVYLESTRNSDGVYTGTWEGAREHLRRWMMNRNARLPTRGKTGRGRLYWSDAVVKSNDNQPSQDALPSGMCRFQNSEYGETRTKMLKRMLVVTSYTRAGNYMPWGVRVRSALEHPSKPMDLTTTDIHHAAFDLLAGKGGETPAHRFLKNHCDGDNPSLLARWIGTPPRGNYDTEDYQKAAKHFTERPPEMETFRFETYEDGLAPGKGRGMNATFDAFLSPWKDGNINQDTFRRWNPLADAVVVFDEWHNLVVPRTDAYRFSLPRLREAIFNATADTVILGLSATPIVSSSDDLRREINLLRGNPGIRNDAEGSPRLMPDKAYRDTLPAGTTWEAAEEGESNSPWRSSWLIAKDDFTDARGSSLTDSTFRKMQGYMSIYSSRYDKDRFPEFDNPFKTKEYDPPTMHWIPMSRLQTRMYADKNRLSTSKKFEQMNSYATPWTRAYASVLCRADKNYTSDANRVVHIRTWDDPHLEQTGMLLKERVKSELVKEYAPEDGEGEKMNMTKVNDAIKLVERNSSEAFVMFRGESSLSSQILDIYSDEDIMSIRWEDDPWLTGRVSRRTDGTGQSIPKIFHVVCVEASRRTIETSSDQVKRVVEHGGAIITLTAWRKMHTPPRASEDEADKNDDEDYDDDEVDYENGQFSGGGKNEPASFAGVNIDGAFHIVTKVATIRKGAFDFSATKRRSNISWDAWSDMKNAMNSKKSKMHYEAYRITGLRSSDGSESERPFMFVPVGDTGTRLRPRLFSETERLPMPRDLQMSTCLAVNSNGMTGSRSSSVRFRQFAAGVTPDEAEVCRKIWGVDAPTLLEWTHQKALESVTDADARENAESGEEAALSLIKSSSENIWKPVLEEYKRQSKEEDIDEWRREEIQREIDMIEARDFEDGAIPLTDKMFDIYTAYANAVCPKYLELAKQIAKTPGKQLVFVGDNARGLQTIANVLRSVGFEQWDQATPRGQPEYTQEFSRGRATSAPKMVPGSPDGYLSPVDQGGWGRRKRFTILKSSASCSNDSMGKKSPFQTQSDRLASSRGPGIGVQLLKEGTSYGDNPNCGASGYRRLGSHLMARAADSFFRGKTRHVRGLAYSSQGQENYDYGITQKHAGSKEGVMLNGNVHGEYVQVALLFTPDYSEGVSFHDVRAIHILDAPENLKTYEQIIGRARRTCSHNQLQFPDQYTIRIHMYSMVFSPDAPYRNTDESTSGADVTDDQGHCNPHCEWRVNSLRAKRGKVSAESCTPNADISSLVRCPNTRKLLTSILESNGGNSNAEEATQLTADAAIWLRAISAWQPVYDLRRSIYTVAVDCEANSWRIYGQANGPCGQKQDSESPSFSLPENGESPLACAESLREIVNTRLWEGSSEEEPVAIADSVFAKARDAVAKTSFRCSATHLRAYLERLVSSLSEEHRIIKEDAREYDDLLKINPDAQGWARVQRLKTLLLKGRDTDFVFSTQTLQIPEHISLSAQNTDTLSGASGSDSATSAGGSSSSVLPGNVKIKTKNQTSDLDADTFVKAIDLNVEIFDDLRRTLEFKSKFVRLYKAHQTAESDKKLLEAMEKQQRDSDKRKVEEYRQRQKKKQVHNEYARLKDLDREDAAYDAAQDLRDLERLKRLLERRQLPDDEKHDMIDNLIDDVRRKKRRASLQNKLKQSSHYRLVVKRSKKAPNSFRTIRGDKRYAMVEQCAESPFLRVASTNVIPPDDVSNPNMPYTAQVELSAFGWDLGEWVVWATVDDSEGGKETKNGAQTYDESNSDSDNGVSNTATTVMYHFRVTKNEQEKWTPRDEGMISAKNDKEFLQKLQKPMSGTRRQTVRISGWTQKSERVRKNLLAGIVGMGLHSLCEWGQKCQTITSALREGVRSQVSNNDHRLWCPEDMSAKDMRELMSADLILTPPLHSANMGAAPEVVSFSKLMQTAFVRDCPDNRKRRRQMPNYAESDEESEDDTSENLSRSVSTGDTYQARNLPPADPGYKARGRGDVLVHKIIKPTF